MDTHYFCPFFHFFIHFYRLTFIIPIVSLSVTKREHLTEGRLSPQLAHTKITKNSKDFVEKVAKTALNGNSLTQTHEFCCTFAAYTFKNTHSHHFYLKEIFV